MESKQPSSRPQVHTPSQTRPLWRNSGIENKTKKFLGLHCKTDDYKRNDHLNETPEKYLNTTQLSLKRGWSVSSNFYESVRHMIGIRYIRVWAAPFVYSKVNQ